MRIHTLKNSLVLLLLCFMSAFAYALPFNIEPKAGQPFPTTVQPGQTVTAYYTVTNNTISQRNDNFVKSLPQNVTQVVSGGTFSDTCGKTFNLTQKGLPNDSCTLQLTISGPVKSNDQNRLLVCFPGGVTCAGTTTPLNVVQTPIVGLSSIVVTPFLNNIDINATTQMTAVGVYSDASTQDLSSTVAWLSSNTAVATISNTGIATGISHGNTTITATFNGLTSNSAILGVDNPVFSIAITPSDPTQLIPGGTTQYTAVATFFDHSTGDITSSATWNSSNTAVATINNIAHPGQATGIASGTTNITATLDNVTSNSAVLNVNNLLYTTIPEGLAVSPLDANGVPLSQNTVTLTEPIQSMVVNTAKTYLYGIFESGSIAGVQYAIDPNDGSLTLHNGGFEIVGLSNEFVSAAINPTDTFYYIADRNNGLVYYCPISSLNGSVSACQTTGSNFGSGPTSITINPAGTLAYITNEISVVDCPIVQTGPAAGSLGACSPLTTTNISSPTNLTFLNATLAYIGGFVSQLVYCPVNPDGTFGTCNVTGSSGNQTSPVVINSINSLAYITTSLDYCTINLDGTLTNCQPNSSGFELGNSGAVI